MVLLPEGANLTLSELREIAARQQQQIEAQQQLLIAKVQRLKFLKQQEARHHQEAQTTENERLRFLQEKLETQEIKLRRLRTLNGQVEQQRTNNNKLSTELESVQLVISEKEKELSSAIEKVGDLTLQLEELRQGNLNDLQNDNISSSPSAQELAKLRHELLYHSKLTEQQSVRISQQRKLLSQREDEVVRADQKIWELKQRLHRKQVHNQQLSKQLQMTVPKSNNQKQLRPSCNVAAVEPVRRPQEQERSQDDFHAKLTTADFREFLPNKNDPKYQTLPYNTKFTMRNGIVADEPDATLHKVETKSVIVSPVSIEKENNFSSKSVPSECTLPTVSANKLYTPSKLSHLSPRPYGSPYIVCHPSTTIPISAANSGSTVIHPATSNATNYTVSVSVSLAPPLPPPQPLPISRMGPSIHSGTYKNDNSSTAVSNQAMDKTSSLHPFTNSSIHSNSMPWVKSLPNKSDDKTKFHLDYNSFSSNSSSNNNNNKPIVPPKPVKPLPPPRQIHVDGNSDEKQDSVDLALAVLKNAGLENSGGYSGYRERLLYYQCFPRYGLKGNSSKIHHTDKKEQSKQDDTQGSNSENSSISCKDESAPKRTIIGQLPIQPKPLTIKKPMGVEPPRLRNSSIPVSSSYKRSLDTNLQAHSILGMQFGNSTSHKHPIARKTEQPPIHYVESNEIPNLENETVANSNETSSSTEAVNISSLQSTVDRMDHDKQNEEERSTSFSKFEVQVETDDDNFGGIGSIDSENNIRTEGDGDSGCETVPTNSSSCLCEIKSEPENNLRENIPGHECVALRRVKKGNLRTKDTTKSPRRVSFDPLALLLDASLEGEVELVKKTACEVANPSAANDEGITALHNAICAGHLEIVTFLVELGCDVNTQDSDGWTPLHCAASCNNLPMVKYLVEHGACIFATTFSDHETAAEKCEEDEDGFDGCSEYLYSIQEKLGIMNGGVVYAVYDYELQNPDELSFNNGDEIVILKKGDDVEREWWWSSLNNQEGYVPRNLLGLYPRVNNRSNQ